MNSDVIIGQNCFFRDSMFHVYNTTYLFMARSDDKGKTWTYKVLNPQVKSDGDAQLVTSPGNGLVLRDGTLVASVWERPDEFENPNGWIASNNDRSGFIYSKDDGVTWERMEGIGVYSNENHIVELNDISLRMFYRYDAEGGKISYIDTRSDGAGYTWRENCQSELEADVACNLSVLSYSKTVGGRQVILISCPATVKIGNIRYKVTSVAANAFRNNRRLKKVTLGDEIQKIGKEAFKGCRKLGTVNIKSKKLKKIGKNALKGIKPNAKINVFSNKLNAYKALFSGKGLGNKVQWNRK